MARQLRWRRGWNHNIVGSPGERGNSLDVRLPGALPGETFTRVRLSTQLIWQNDTLLNGPWDVFAMFGVIVGPANLPSTPARPMDDPLADWLWWTSFQWESGRTVADVSGSVLNDTAQGHLRDIDIRAQREADPVSGSSMWFVWQWGPGMEDNQVVVRGINFSVGILEPAGS